MGEEQQEVIGVPGKGGVSKVEVTDEYEFVDHKTRIHHIHTLEKDAVWGGHLKHDWFLSCL